MRFRPDHLQRGGRTAERAAALRPQRNLRRRLRHDAARTTAPNENGCGGVRIAASLLVEMWGLEPQTPYMRNDSGAKDAPTKKARKRRKAS
jgi:hypothetical protein